MSPITYEPQQQQQSDTHLKLDTSNSNNNNNNNNKITILDLPIEILFHIFKIETNSNFYNIQNPIHINSRITTPTAPTTIGSTTIIDNNNNSKIEKTKEIQSNYNSYNSRLVIDSIIQFSKTCKYVYYLFQDETFWYNIYRSYFKDYSLIDIDRKCLTWNDDILKPLKEVTVSSSTDENDRHQAEKEFEETEQQLWKNRFIKRKHPWNLKEIKCKKEIQGQKGITSLEVDDKYLYSGSHDTDINLYGLDNQLVPISTLQGHQSTIWSLKSDGKRLYSASNDHTIRIWDIDSKKCESIIQDTTKIFSIAIKGDSIFSSSDNNVKVWNTSGITRETPGELISILKGHRGGINKIQISDDHLFSGSSDGSVIIWDLNTLKSIGSREDPTDKILSLELINSNTLVTGSQNCQIKFWDIRQPKSLPPIVSLINAHKWEVWQLELCGGYLFSGSFDHTIKIWDLNNFKNLSTISSHRSYIHALTSSSFNLFSGSADKYIKCWSSN